LTTLPLFEPAIPAELTGVRLEVAGLLLDNRGRWLKSKHIAQRVGLRNSADVRHLIQELVDNYGLELIGDRTEGFRFADSRAEFEEHQAANLKQAVTTFYRVRARLGERRFRGLLVKLKIHEAMGLEKEIVVGEFEKAI
jgi:hypothetical protein